MANKNSFHFLFWLIFYCWNCIAQGNMFPPMCPLTTFGTIFCSVAPWTLIHHPLTDTSFLTITTFYLGLIVLPAGCSPGKFPWFVKPFLCFFMTAHGKMFSRSTIITMWTSIYLTIIGTCWATLNLSSWYLARTLLLRLITTSALAVRELSRINSLLKGSDVILNWLNCSN